MEFTRLVEWLGRVLLRSWGRLATGLLGWESPPERFAGVWIPACAGMTGESVVVQRAALIGAARCVRDDAGWDGQGIRLGLRG